MSTKMLIQGLGVALCVVCIYLLGDSIMKENANKANAKVEPVVQLVETATVTVDEINLNVPVME